MAVVHVQPVRFHELLAAVFVRLQACAVARQVFPRQAAGVVTGALHGHRAVTGGFPHLADVSQVVAAVVVIIVVTWDMTFCGKFVLHDCKLFLLIRTSRRPVSFKMITPQKINKLFEHESKNTNLFQALICTTSLLCFSILQ